MVHGWKSTVNPFSHLHSISGSKDPWRPMSAQQYPNRRNGQLDIRQLSDKKGRVVFEDQDIPGQWIAIDQDHLMHVSV